MASVPLLPISERGQGSTRVWFIRFILQYQAMSSLRDVSHDGVHSVIDQPTEYIFYCKRAILFPSSSKILTPHPPLRPASRSSPSNKGVHTRRAERGMGGQYFGRREKQDCPLTVKYVLCGSAPHRGKWCGPSGQAAWTVHHVQNHTLLGHSPQASQPCTLWPQQLVNWRVSNRVPDS